MGRGGLGNVRLGNGIMVRLLLLLLLLCRIWAGAARVGGAHNGSNFHIQHPCIVKYLTSGNLVCPADGMNHVRIAREHHHQTAVPSCANHTEHHVAAVPITTWARSVGVATLRPALRCPDVDGRVASRTGCFRVGLQRVFKFMPRRVAIVFAWL